MGYTNKKNKMNLYRIISSHYSPKDSFTSTLCFLLADNEEQIYNFIKNCSSIFEEYVAWCGAEDDLYWNEETNEDDLTHKEWVVLNKGELDCDEFLEDLYYGQTLFGWELVKEDITESDQLVLTNLKVAIKA